MRIVERQCFDCGDKRARWPKDNPAFCTKTCAANWAAEWTTEMCEAALWPCLENGCHERGCGHYVEKSTLLMPFGLTDVSYV